MPEPIIFGPLPPPYGGVSTFMSSLASGAPEHGVRVWSYAGKPGSGDAGIEYVNHRRLGHLRLLFKDGRGARITDSTHFHLEYPNPLLLPAWLIARSLLDFRWIKVLHDGSLPARFEKFGFHDRRLFHLAIRAVDEVVAVDDVLKGWLVESLGYRGKVHVIPASLPQPPEWSTAVTDTDTVRVLERSDAHTRRVCSLGIFIPAYGFHHVVEAVERLRRETQEDIGLMLIDGGFAGDHRYREDILRGRDWITVAKEVPHPQIGQIYKSSDVLVRATEHESIGLCRIEAICAGIPVIATDVGETRGMLTYRYGDIDALCVHLRSVLEGGSKADTKHWADIFESEARKNRSRYWQVITGQAEHEIPDQKI